MTLFLLRSKSKETQALIVTERRIGDDPPTELKEMARLKASTFIELCCTFSEQQRRGFLEDLFHNTRVLIDDLNDQ